MRKVCVPACAFLWVCWLAVVHLCVYMCLIGGRQGLRRRCFGLPDAWAAAWACVLVGVPN